MSFKDIKYFQNQVVSDVLKYKVNPADFVKHELKYF